MRAGCQLKIDCHRHQYQYIKDQTESASTFDPESEGEYTSSQN